MARKSGWRNWEIGLMIAAASLMLLKWVVAARLELFGDEAFYWQCARHPALAYADLPPVTSQLVRWGTLIWGDTPFGVRFFFLVCGLIFPLVVYGLAKPYTGARPALVSASLALVFPNLGMLGFNALPDTPLLLISTLFLWGVERGTRSPRLQPWLWAGLAAALGLMTHYRFAVMPMATGLYLLFSRNRLRHLKGLLICGLVALPGLFPALFYNLQHHFAPLTYFLAVRHAIALDWSQVPQHLGEQAALVTPLLYGLSVALLVVLWRKMRVGGDRALLFFTFATFPLVFYLAASPFHASGPLTLHWPMIGYVPLLVWLPPFLTDLCRRGPTARFSAQAGPGFALICMFVILVELGFSPLGVRALHKPFAGWFEIGRVAESHWKHRNEEFSAIVAGDYLLGSNLDFQFEGEVPLFILAHSKNFEHGRQLQFDQWNQGEKGLISLQGKTVLFIMNEAHIAADRTGHWRRHLDYLFADRMLLEEVGVGRGRSEARFSIYKARLSDIAGE